MSATDSKRRHYDNFMQDCVCNLPRFYLLSTRVNYQM
jgi:hypothetical protein